MASDRKLVEHDPSWGILRNKLFCREVTDCKDAPARGLEGQRQANILADHSIREKIHLTFISLFSGKKNLYVDAKILTVPPPSTLSLPPPSQFIKTFWLKVPDCVILSCSCARPVPPAPQIWSSEKIMEEVESTDKLLYCWWSKVSNCQRVVWEGISGLGLDQIKIIYILYRLK